jgi:hypothetical protein
MFNEVSNFMNTYKRPNFTSYDLALYKYISNLQDISEILQVLIIRMPVWYNFLYILWTNDRDINVV